MLFFIFIDLLTKLIYIQLTKYPVLNAFEDRTQVPKAYAVLSGFFLLTILLAINPLAAPVSNFVGWLLPAYLSFKAIESPSAHDDVQWLTYWVVFGFFNFIESFALRIVLYYLPWYFAMKTSFIVWLQLPAFRVRLLAPRLFHVASCAYRVLRVNKRVKTRTSFFFSIKRRVTALPLTLLCFSRAHKSPTSMSSSPFSLTFLPNPVP